MKNWFDIVQPHEDIRRGDFDESVFAAKLEDVAAGRAPSDYNDPHTFFKKTYLTVGLKKLLFQVQEKLTVGKGPSIIELQTPFGGGKTHALVLIYHFLVNGKDIGPVLPEGLSRTESRVGVIVGKDLNPLEGRTSSDTHRRTLWGEIAFQLGGEESYRLLESNDKERISPGKDGLRKVLEPLQPFVLLFDEVLEYIVRARGVTYADTSLGAQSVSFLDEVTEVIAGIDNAMLIATLPSSELEDFGDAEQRNLTQLHKVLSRQKAFATPVQGEEIYSIIRRRLFEDPDDELAIREIVDSYISVYQQHKDELPAKARESEYRRKLVLAYPFHPDVIDILYEKWSTFSTFQRTRGALRLLANVIEDLYNEESNLDLILPGDINLDAPSIRQEFLEHIGQEYEGVIASDVAGVEAKSQTLDRAHRDWKHLAQRIATGIFLHSFAADDSEKGIGLPNIKLAVLRPDTIPAYVTEVLHKQQEELWYLNSRGDRYYFSDVPNLNRMVLDKKELVKNGVRGELQRRIRAELGTRMRCYLWPHESGSVPDNTEIKLVVIDPEHGPTIDQLEEWVESKGDNFRVYKNTLFFALSDPSRYAKVSEELKEFLALQEIGEELEGDDRPGMREKIKEVDRRLRDLVDEFPLRVRELYRTAAVPMAGSKVERVDLGQPSVGKENLDTWYWRELSEESRQKIMTRPPSAKMLETKFLGEQDELSLAVLLEQFYKEPGMPVPAEPNVIAQSLIRAVRNKELALASKRAGVVDAESIRFGDEIHSDEIRFDEHEILLTAAQAFVLIPEAASEAAGNIEPAPSPGQTPPPGTVEPPEEKGQEEQLKRVALQAKGLPASRIADLNRGVFLPISKAFGDFQFSISIDVHSDEGISKKIVKQQVLETLRQLGAEVEMEDSEEA